MRSKKTLLYLVVLLLASCGGKSSNTIIGNAETATSSDGGKKEIIAFDSNNVIFEKTRAVELNDDFSNLSDVQEKLNTFKIKAKLKRSFSSDANFSCYKIKAGGEVVESIIPAGSLSKTVEVEIKNDEFNAVVNCRLSYEGHEVAGNFKLIKSMIIDSEMKLRSFSLQHNNGAYELDRLIFTQSGKLITDGESFTLNVERLYSNQGEIQTFRLEDRSGQKQNQAGKSGGEIKIFSQRSSGILYAHLYGQDGDDQTLVPAQVSGVPERASGAVAETFKEVCTRAHSGGGGRPGSRDGGTADDINCVTRLDNPGRPASNGNKGYDGLKGFDGNDGGNSGSIYLTSEEEIKFNLIFDEVPGTGGKGGRGGPGGVGGPGGIGAGKYGAGATGPQGDEGRVGDNGKNGTILKSCSMNKSKNLSKCNGRD